MAAQSLESAFKSTERAAAQPALLAKVREEEVRRKTRTWRDIPQDELAERLSKGEIIGRDEWIPGLSQGRRKLDKNMLESHLEFGQRIHREGNTAYENNDYELAFTRYTQVC